MGPLWGGGTSRGPPVGLCHQSLSHPRHCVHRVCKGEVSPGDSWAWVLMEPLRSNGSFPEQCWTGVPDLPCVQESSLVGEDVISV